MADIRIPTDLKVALERALLPTLTQWNRLEGRPRTAIFDRSVRAEVRDGLWMLTRQWQLGEFRADDAGSPVLAQMRIDHTRLTKTKFGEDPIEPMVDELPLETRVERLRAPLMRGTRKIALDLRLLLGRQWLKSTAGIGDYADAYRARYPITLPDPGAPADVDVCAHPGALAMVSALAGRAMDGGELYLHLLEPGAHAWDGIAVADADKAGLDAAAARFVRWFARLISQPPPDRTGAWTPDHLEYRFDCSAPTAPDAAKVYAASDYAAGRLDWWAVDADPSRTRLDTAPEDPTVIGSVMRTMIPSQLQFDGMPNARWWAFEDGKVNLGKVSAATTDLAKLLFIEFGLVYSNDWFLTPFTAPAGTIAELTGCAVTNTFGERFWITPAAVGRDDDPRRFTLFTSSVRVDPRLPADTSLLLLPTANTVTDGPVHEEVLFLRDEMANMVWAVERSVALPDGSTRPGSEVAYETRTHLERLAAGADPDADTPPAADIRYRAMTTVPENWIPFIAAQKPTSHPQIRLQRAAMPRLLPGRPPERVLPLTDLLRAGLDRRRPYFVHEEEVPREGLRLTTRFQRTRWRDGRVVVWLGAQKAVGRGEGSSGLGFDRVMPTPRNNDSG
ncbi:hypothetical protein IU479_32440 [Nocardia abscessus]|uniref:hypothetical protein n=1 Tax=Nocardia abscessus TaxID=120957 RepID=UPI001894741D|nr:hypothetical protein [Nocardia abscessus]MBF6222796.1 hypothetical protein [Nocardia abscessus]